MEELPRTSSQEHDTESIDGLVESTRLQADNIENLLEALEVLGDKVEERPTRKGVWKITAIVGALILTAVLTLAWLSYDSSHDALEQIKDCTTAEGECAQEQAANSSQVVGRIVCNQEKVVYFIEPEFYEPLPFCADIINSEIERVGGILGETIPLVEVDPSVPQITPLKDSFKANGS